MQTPSPESSAPPPPFHHPDHALAVFDNNWLNSAQIEASGVATTPINMIFIKNPMFDMTYEDITELLMFSQVISFLDQDTLNQYKN